MLHFRNLGDPNVAATPKALAAAAVVDAALAAAIATVIEAMWAQRPPIVARVGDLALADVVVLTAANRCCSRTTDRAMPLVASISTVAGDCNYYCCYHCYC